MRKRSNFLVLVGVAVFLAGTTLTVLSMRGLPAHGSTPAAGEVVVAARAIPAGTTGATMVEQQLVRLATSPAHRPADAVVSLDDLDDVVLTSPLQAGEVLRLSQLAAGTGVPLPAGDQAITITIDSGAAAVAGYVKPGDTVDVYATIDKLSSPGVVTTALPCTELVAADVPVLDVSTVVPGYVQQPSPSGRPTPSSETVLLAATPRQAPQLVFMTTNEQIYLTKVPAGQAAPPLYQCIGTGQMVGSPSPGQG